MNPGSAFWFDLTAVGPHLLVVLSRPTADGKVVVVSVTTLRGRRYEDPSCVFGPADHEDLAHESWVKYDAAKLYDSDFIIKFGRRTSDLRAEVLARVLAGAAASGRMRLELRELLVSQGLID